MLNVKQVGDVLDRQLFKNELHTVNYVAGFCIEDVTVAKCFYFRTSHCWNQLPSFLKSITKHSTFKPAVK